MNNNNAYFNKLESEGKAHRILKKDGDEGVIQVRNAPVITSEKSGDVKEYRKNAKEFLNTLKGSFVVNKYTGEKVFFTKYSINELLQNTGTKKLRSLFHIKEIIENAKPTTVEEIKESNNPLKKDSDFVYNMECIVMIDGLWYEYGFKTFVKMNESKKGIDKITIYSGHLPKEKPI